jgi:hypothetical protein
MHRPGWRFRTIANLNFLIVDVSQHLTEVPHISSSAPQIGQLPK